MRHKQDVEIICGCGNKAALPFLTVVEAFHRNKWPIGMDTAAQYFRCSKCGQRPERIGPEPR